MMAFQQRLRDSLIIMNKISMLLRLICRKDSVKLSECLLMYGLIHDALNKAFTQNLIFNLQQLIIKQELFVKFMKEKLPQHKRRVKSQMQSSERDKKILPLLKPRYVMENMFAYKKLSKDKYAQRTQSTQKYGKNVKRNTYETQISQQSWRRQSKIGQDLTKIRYKLKDFYRNLVSSKKEAFQTHKQDIIEQQNSDERNIRFSFVKRRVKRHFNAEGSNRQQIRSLQQIQSIFNEKILFTPVLLHRNFANSQQDVIKYGKIKRQSTISPQKPKKQHKLKLNNKNLQRVLRKIGNVILFIVYLRRYNKKYQASRKRFLQKNSKNIQLTLLQLKLYFSHHFTPLYEALCLKYQELYQISQKDQQSARSIKLSTLRHLVNILMGCLSRGVDNLKARTNFIQLIYSICKHGSFSCLWSFYTQQQLDISCISSQLGYISGDYYLQQSYIIGFLFIKIVIYNIFLKPELINFTLSPLFDKTKLYHNMKLIGNIFYEILIDLQDNYMQMANEEFKIGNWRGLTYKYNIKSSESMTVKKGFYQKNELISGLIGHSYIKQTCQIEAMMDESRIVKEIVTRVHIIIKEYHMLVRNKIM